MVLVESLTPQMLSVGMRSERVNSLIRDFRGCILFTFRALSTDIFGSFFSCLSSCFQIPSFSSNSCSAHREKKESQGNSFTDCPCSKGEGGRERGTEKQLVIKKDNLPVNLRQRQR